MKTLILVTAETFNHYQYFATKYFPKHKFSTNLDSVCLLLQAIRLLSKFVFIDLYGENYYWSGQFHTTVVLSEAVAVNKSGE